MMTYEKFEEYIKCIQYFIEFQDEVNKACYKLWKQSKYGDCELNIPTMVDVVLDLLATVMGDEKTEWIPYFCFDLHFGEEYRDGMITESDGSIVKLATIEDLWNILSKNLSK